jgi:hypothetical protein
MKSLEATEFLFCMSVSSQVLGICLKVTDSENLLSSLKSIVLDTMTRIYRLGKRVNPKPATLTVG